MNDLFAGVYMEQPLMKVIITITFCFDNLWKSKLKPVKLMKFFLSLFSLPV